jgi:CobQ/CobB/MinD/ParA nucleotide binding domain
VETYAFANQKGGVGKTTVTRGRAAASRGRTCRIDLDPQAWPGKTGAGFEEPQRTAVRQARRPWPFRLPFTSAIPQFATGTGKEKIPLECGIPNGETRTRTGGTTIFRQLHVTLDRL